MPDALLLPPDPTTQSNWQEVASEHVDFDWSIDFAQQTISGSATHLLRVKKDDVREAMYAFLSISLYSAISHIVCSRIKLRYRSAPCP